MSDRPKKIDLKNRSTVDPACRDVYKQICDFIEAVDSCQWLDDLSDEVNKIDEEAHYRLVEECMAISRAFQRYIDLETKTLDEAFDLRRPFKWHFESARKRREIARIVRDDIQALASAGAGIGQDMFEAVAELYSTNRPVVQALWTSRPRPRKPVKNDNPLPAHLEEVFRSLGTMDKKKK